MNNVNKYKDDLSRLISLGDNLFNSIQYESYPEEFKSQIKPKLGKEYDSLVSKLISFHDNYQKWYSECIILIKQLLPDRLADFIKHYEKSKTRKELTHSNYVIEDYLQGTRLTRNGELRVGPGSAVSQFRQQLNIVKSITQRFESSLFEIKQLVQADLFDSELDAAKELLKNNFYRAAGMMSGVVLEKYLKQICEGHNLKIANQKPTINDFNEVLKNNNIIDIAQWRFIGYLADIRNLCGHNKKIEPTSENINDLIAGVDKVIKTIS